MYGQARGDEDRSHGSSEPNKSLEKIGWKEGTLNFVRSDAVFPNTGSSEKRERGWEGGVWGWGVRGRAGTQAGIVLPLVIVQ